MSVIETFLNHLEQKVSSSCNQVKSLNVNQICNIIIIISIIKSSKPKTGDLAGRNLFTCIVHNNSNEAVTNFVFDFFFQLIWSNFIINKLIYFNNTWCIILVSNK